MPISIRPIGRIVSLITHKSMETYLNLKKRLENSAGVFALVAVPFAGANAFAEQASENSGSSITGFAKGLVGSIAGFGVGVVATLPIAAYAVWNFSRPTPKAPFLEDIPLNNALDTVIKANDAFSNSFYPSKTTSRHSRTYARAAQEAADFAMIASELSKRADVISERNNTANKR